MARNQREVYLNGSSVESWCKPEMIENSEQVLDYGMKLRNHELFKMSLDKVNKNEEEFISNEMTSDKLSKDKKTQNSELEQGGSNAASSVTEVKLPGDTKAFLSNVEDVTDKQFEELTTIKRPKRRGCSGINYNENALSASDPLFECRASSRKEYCHSTQSRKVRPQKVPNETPRLIHSDSHFVDLFRNLHRLQKDGKYCDIKFCGSDGNMLVHSLVLIAASPLLHKKIKQKINKNSHLNGLTELDFINVPMKALQKIVTFLYTGSVEVPEFELKSLSQHCRTLGLNDLCKKLCSVDSIVVPDLSLCDQKEEMIADKDVKKSGSGNLKVKDELHSFNRTTRKRKLKSNKNVKMKIKSAKKCVVINERITGIENNAIMNFERLKKECVIADKNSAVKIEEKSNKVEDDAELEEINCLNIDTEVNEDDGWNTDHVDSGDDTDSYYVDESNKNQNKKCKFSKKGIKNKENRRLRKTGKYEKMRNDESLKCSTEILPENESKVDENLTDTIDTCKVESKVQSKQNKADVEEESKKLELDIGSGNGGKCEKCGKSFFFQYELTGHRNKCTGRNNRQRRKCVTCHVNFDSTEEYMEHRNSDVRCIKLRQEKLAERKQKRFEMRRKYCCCACSRKFRRLADQIEHEFLAHEIQYDKEKWPDLYCEYCNYWSMNPWKLHHHKLVSCNKGQEPICDMCGNSYKNEKTLKKHKELMHTDIQPMLTCEECGKTLKGKKGLKHHIRLRHRGENLHNLMMCHICSQTYRTSSDLTFHLYKVHDQPLPEGFIVHRCPRCDYCHNNKRFFDKHMFLHEDKREWHCEICSKAFKTKNSLSTHMIVHTSNRIPCPFDDCTYKALKNCHLKNHIENQHTQKGEKHEKCHLCEYSTFFRGNLIKHQRSVHKLEVVTRHSVEMKARYKNLKSGQILGVKDDILNDKKTKSTDLNTSSVVQESEYPTSLSSLSTSTCDKSMVEDQCHFQDKSFPLPSSNNITEPFVYTLGNTPMISHHTNYPTNTNMYGMPTINFSMYSQNPPMDQM